MADSTHYVMGETAEERDRLIRQSAHLAPLTEVMLKEAGIGPGMKVLDVGCGTGGVSHLVARLVGESGSVQGLDRDETTLTTARRLAAHAKLPHLTFTLGTLETITLAGPFDAVVGRFVLVHQIDPLTLVRKAVEVLRPGGALAFLEPDFTPRPVTWPPVADVEKAWNCIIEVFARTGLPQNMGLRLHHTLRNAGLENIGLRGEVSAGGGPQSFIYEWIANAAVSLGPVMEKLGIITAAEMNGFATAEHFAAETNKLGAQIQGPPLIAAWGKKPV